MVSILILIGILLLLYGIVALIINKANKSAGTKGLPYAKPSLITGLIIVAVFSMIVRIGGQEVGVVVTPLGIRDNELNTGWHIIMPWNSVYRMDKTQWVYTFSSTKQEGSKRDADAIWAPTKDGIKMGFDVSITWKIDPEYGSWIYANISEADGGDNGRYKWIEENIIRTKAKSVLALTVSEYTPIECYSNKREEIQQRSFERLKKDFSEKHLILLQIDLREVFYNPEYETAINAKKLAEQEVLRLVEVTKQKEEQLKQSTIDKDIAIQKAQGESEALKIKGQSISTNPKIIQLEWINKWNGELPQIMTSDKSGILLNISDVRGKE